MTYEWFFHPYVNDTLTGGDYVIIDPGYLMERLQLEVDYLRDLSSLNCQDAIHNCVLKIKQEWHFHVWKTSYGAGSYPVYKFTALGEPFFTHLDSIPTESGYFSLVPHLLVEDLGLANTSLGYHFHNDYFEYFSQMIDRGDVHFGNVAVITSADNLSDSQECKKIILQYLDKYHKADKEPFYSYSFRIYK